MELASLIKTLPIISSFSSSDLAKFIPSVQLLDIEADTVFYHAEENAQYLYYVLAGEVELVRDGEHFASAEDGYFGEEAALGDHGYRSTAKAKTACQVLSIKAKSIQKLISKNTPAIQSFNQSLLRHFAPINAEANISRYDIHAPHAEIQDVIGWLVAIIAPAITYLFLRHHEFPWALTYFATLFMAMVVILMFDLTPLYVPTTVVMVGSLLLGVAPSDIIFHGFTSSAFFMTLSLYALSAVIKHSGLFYRLSLFILTKLPANTSLIRSSVFGIGFFQTPFLTSSTGRIALIVPFLKDVIKNLGYQRGGKLATGLAAAMLYGAYITGSCFLTGKTTNFILFGLLPQQEQHQFSWLYWLLASSVCLVVVSIGFILLLNWFFHSDETKAPPQHLQLQLDVLGKFTRDEWLALSGILILLAGMLTTSLHHIAPPWIAMGLLYLFLALGILPNKQFRHDIDWPFLFFLAGLLGVAQTVHYLGLDNLIFNHFTWLNDLVQTHPYRFVSILFWISAGLLFLLQDAIIVVGMMLTLGPVAQVYDVSPWIIGFVVLVASEVWFLPYQNGRYLMLEQMIGHKRLYNRNTLLKFNVYVNVLRYLSVLASVPLWIHLGLL